MNEYLVMLSDGKFLHAVDNDALDRVESVGNVAFIWKLLPPLGTRTPRLAEIPVGKYRVEIDGVDFQIRLDSLAAVANSVRGRGKHIRIWAPSGMLLVDTAFGDAYGLVSQ